MKKILGVLLIGVFVLAVSAQAGPVGKVGIGLNTTAANLGVMGFTSYIVSYNLTNQFVGKLGLNYNSYKTQGGVTTSQTGFALGVDYLLPMQWGDATPLVGLLYSTDGAAAATSIISLVLGVEAEVAKGVVVGAGLIPYSTATTSGAANPDTGMGTGTLNGVLSRGSYLSATVYVN